MTHLAYLLKKFPRLSETFILNEMLGQESLGRDIHVFSRRPADPEPRHPQLAQLKAFCSSIPHSRDLDPWTELFGEENTEAVFVDRLAALVRELRSYEIPRLSMLLSEALYLRRRCRELGIQHIHVHFATESALTAMILRGLGGPTYSITAHAKDIYRSTVDPALLSRLISASAFTVTVCEANIRHLQGLLSPHALQKIRLLYNGIDLDRFAFVDSGRQAKHILSVGRLVEKKGFLVLVDALALLRDRGLDFSATFVGDGEDRDKIRAYITEKGLDARIFLPGAVDQDAVRELMSSCTVFCLPCVVGADGNRDALPTVLLEALAVGIPTVSTPISGVPEILNDGAAGCLVPEGNAHATADALEVLLSLPDRRAQLATAGRRRAEELFDVNKTSRILASWLDEVLAVEVG